MTENEGAKPAGAKATNDEAAYKNALLERVPGELLFRP
jgi:hypothetical protein